MTLHIFNPDSDYALANGRRWFTPPAHVVAVRRELALLPAIYAAPGDAILLLDSPAVSIESLKYHELAAEKNLAVATPKDLARHPGIFAQHRVEPWGWNAAMRQFALDKLGAETGVPDATAIDNIRRLSHRCTSISFLSTMAQYISQEITIPEEITDAEEGMKAWRSDRHRFFKAPWSSSGRGILLADDLEERHVRPWISGVIARQGAVIMEKAYTRRLDFATEWICGRESAPLFLGFSVFRTSRRGKYHSNVNDSQSNLRSIIESHTDADINMIVDMQAKAIESFIAPFYSGPLGIDMLVTDSGAVNPCVEINLRHTMGMLPLLDNYYNG